MGKSAIITAASNKFFPSLVNLLGSIKNNYPDHPTIFIYDLGLFWTFRKELEKIQNVRVVSMPRFCPFWRSCYTWKTYILSHPLAELNFYIDAGSQILRPLDLVFSAIEQLDYFAVSQAVPLSTIVPKEYKSLIEIDEKYYQQPCITAGIFGFKGSSSVSKTLKALYERALEGMCLGFSPNDQWRNKGVNKSDFVRDCQSFRHDTTLLSMLMRKDFGDFIIQDVDKYAGAYSPTDHSGQVIWNLRLNYVWLGYLSPNLLHDQFNLAAIFNRMVIYVFMSLRVLNLFIKGKLWEVKNLKKSAL